MLEKPTYYLYSSEGCHLCEQALMLLCDVIAKDNIRVIDIVDDQLPGQDLVALYGVKIPVLERLIDNKTLCWPFDKRQIIQFIQ